MYCNNCGTQLNHDQAYCPGCGAPIYQAPAQPSYQPTVRNPTSTALIAVCSVLATILVGLCLTATGVINFRGAQSGSVEQTKPKAQSVTSETSGDDEKSSNKGDVPENVVINVTAPTTSTPTTENEPTTRERTQSATTVIAVPTTPAPTNTTPAPSAPSAPSTPSSSGYVISGVTSCYLSRGDLSGYSDWQLYIGRNEIYARYGRGFKKWNLRNYFENCSWYSCRYDADSFNDNMLSDIERANAQTILDEEDARGSIYTYGDEYLQP